MTAGRLRILAAALATGLGAAPVMAHPHVWVTMRSDVVFTDDGLIKAVNLEWSFDDAYTKMALDGLDSNGDGVYSQSELAPLTRDNMTSLKDYDYFTAMRVGNTKLAIGPVTEFGQIWSDGKLELHFQVPLKAPLDPRSGVFTVKVYDPDFFIAMDYVPDDPVSVLGTMPQGCRLEVKPVPTDAELDQTRTMLASKGKDWQPDSNEDFGAMFAQPVSILCAS